MELKHINLRNITSPEFVKTLSIKELVLLCEDIRHEIISATSKNGGHVGSNLGVVELTVALHYVFDFTKDKLLLDVGHQCYTHKILTGRNLDTLRQKDGISGFQKRYESPYDCFEAGHSSTSLSTGYGMAVARDLKGDKYDIVTVIGDGAIANGLAFEGLNNIGHGSHKVIVIFNDNDMSISKPVGGFSRFLQRVRSSISYNRKKKSYQRIMCKTRIGYGIYNISAKIKNRVSNMFLSTNIFDTLGFVYLGPIDGHDMKSLIKAFKQAQHTNRSVVVHVQTMKGKGYKYAEEDKKGLWHGVPPFDIETGEFKVACTSSWSKIVADNLLFLMKENENTILINPAMIEGSCLNEVFDSLPQRCFDVGICEEHAFTMASGFALANFHPIISVYSTFMQRAYDEIQQDIARMNLNCTILIDRSGLVGADGETHQGIFDEAMLYSIPTTTITMPSNETELKYLLKESLNNHGIFAIRYPKDNLNICENEKVSFSYGEWKYLRIHGSKTVLISYGPIINDILKTNLSCDVINAIYQRPILEDNIQKLLKYQRIIIYTPYATKRGFCLSLIGQLSRANYQGKIEVLALDDAFISAGTIKEQMEDNHVSIDDLVKFINKGEEKNA